MGAPSSFPPSGPPQHVVSYCPQLSWQLLLHVPLGVQHMLPLHTSGDVQPHGTWLPHPSDALTLHEFPQLFVGVQQSVVARSQTCPAGHPFDGHERNPPQLSMIIALQRPAHVASVQHVKGLVLVLHCWPDGHKVVPLTPQFTVCMQLFSTELHWLLPHAIAGVSAEHPHAPLVQASPPSQPGHVTILPQLSVVMLQRLSHQCGSDAQMHVPSGAHPSPGAHVPVQFHVTPHESVPGLQRFWQKVRSGVHASASAGASFAGASVASSAAGASSASSVETSSSWAAESAESAAESTFVASASSPPCPSAPPSLLIAPSCAGASSPDASAG
jgi:hypothetical protein